MRVDLKALTAVLIAASTACVADELAAPVPVKVGGQQLDVEHMGHAAPFVGDFDRDGLKDLLVGEFYKGRLRIYRNLGTNSKPRFEDFKLFQDGAPSGCIYAS